MADFDPRQLDELEDALESLGHVDDLEQLELGPELTERLAEYQDVLALCRDAFPLESVDDRVLVDVLAEAREVSRRPRLRDVVAGERSGWRSFWERWRGSLVPAFALAGTAAVMLWVLDPGQSNHQGAELLTQVDRTPTPDEKPTQPTQPTQPSEQAKDEPAPKSDDNAASEQAGVEPTPEVVVEPQRKAAKKASAPAPAVTPAEPAPEPMNKDEAWDELDRADAARRDGNCDRARQRYESVIEASPDKLAIARAKAGIGLCYEQDRRDTLASKWFEDARATNPTVDTWIRQQRDEVPQHKKAKAKQAEAFDEAL